MMRKTTILAAVMMLGFWGMIGTIALIRSLTPETQRTLAHFAAPTAAILMLTLLLWLIRRRAAARRGIPTLEEVRRLSRQHLAGEPAEGDCMVLPPESKGPCRKKGEGHDHGRNEERPAVDEDCRRGRA
jgi:hypothetical protein